MVAYQTSVVMPPELRARIDALRNRCAAGSRARFSLGQMSRELLERGAADLERELASRGEGR